MSRIIANSPKRNISTHSVRLDNPQSLVVYLIKDKKVPVTGIIPKIIKPIRINKVV